MGIKKLRLLRTVEVNQIDNKGINMANPKISSASKAIYVKAPGKYSAGNGLYLVVGKGGSKSWIFQYRWNGKRPEIGLGSFNNGKGVTLAKARDKVYHLRQSMNEGIEPRSIIRKATSNKPIFSACADAFIAEKQHEWSNAKHSWQWSRSLEMYAYPVLGDMPVDKIDTEHILATLKPIWTTKTETATRVRGRIEQILSWAIAMKHRKGPNPAIWRGNLEMLMAAPSRIRTVEHHPAMDYEQIPEFMQQLKEKQGQTARALELCILSTTRTSEILKAKWNEFDCDTWLVPAERMKAKRAHRIPLVPRALEILDQLPRVDDSRYLFPGFQRGNPTMSIATMLKYLREVMGHNALTVHGFRSTFSTWANDTTHHPVNIVEAQLAHVISNKVQAAYDRGDKLQKRLDLLLDWQRYCYGEVA